MAIHLDSPDVKASEPRRAKPDTGQVQRCGSDALATACWLAVRYECGPWGKVQRDSDHERDALMQSLAVWALEHRERLQSLSREQVQATLRQVLRQDLLRDARHWRDSLEGVAVYGRRTRPLAERVSESVAEQATRAREHERSKRPAPHASMEVLTERHRSHDGDVDWLEVAAEQAADEGDALPRSAYAPHSRELAGRMAERIADAIAPVVVASKDRESIRVALTVAAGETCDAVAVAERCSIATAKRRSTAGHSLLLTVRAMGVDLAAIRRECVADMLAEDRASYPDAWEPRTVAEVDAELALAGKRAAVDGAIACQRAATASYLAGGERPAPRLTRASWTRTASGRKVIARYADRPRGSAAEVLAYIARMERAASVAESPAYTYATVGAVRLATARDRRSAWRSEHREPPKQEPTVPHVAWLWPDSLTAGQPVYSRSHPANADAVRIDGRLVRRAFPEWSFGRTAPRPRPAEPVRVSERAGAEIAERRSLDALTVARRIARQEPTRARRVTALCKLALANLTPCDPD